MGHFHANRKRGIYFLGAAIFPLSHLAPGNPATLLAAISIPSVVGSIPTSNPINSITTAKAHTRQDISKASVLDTGLVSQLS